jgi:hypothetical protein
VAPPRRNFIGDQGFHLATNKVSKANAMMKRIIVLLIAVCMAAAAAIAQSAAPSTPTPSTTPQAASPQTTPVTPPARAKGKHAGHHAALRDIDDPRVKELIAKHHSERRACKANPSSAGCAEMRTRQKSEKRALMTQLRKEGKI